MVGLTPVWSYKFGCVWSVWFRPIQTALCKFGRGGVGVRWDFRLQWFRARLLKIQFVRNFGRVCSRFWLSVRNSVWGPFNTKSRGNPSLCRLGWGVKEHQHCEQTFCEQTGVSSSCEKKKKGNEGKRRLQSASKRCHPNKNYFGIN